MPTILCCRRNCDKPATVDVRLVDAGYVDERVCDEHAKDNIEHMIYKINGHINRVTRKPIVTVRVEWSS